MKFLYILIPGLALVACAGQHPDAAQSPAAERVDNDPLPDSGTIREPSRVHTYIVNDYVDPNNPRERHRGHLVDVVEQDEKWNFAPTDTTATDLGPVTAVNDPNAAPNPYSAEFETELTQQRDQYRQLADLGGKMTTEVSRLQDMAEKSADVISENAELRNRLNELQQEIDTLKPASPVGCTDPGKKTLMVGFHSGISFGSRPRASLSPRSRPVSMPRPFCVPRSPTRRRPSRLRLSRRRPMPPPPMPSRHPVKCPPTKSFILTRHEEYLGTPAPRAPSSERCSKERKRPARTGERNGRCTVATAPPNNGLSPSSSAARWSRPA